MEDFAAGEMKKESSGEIISKLSAYIARTGEVNLPAEVMHKAKQHILDTLEAIICGPTLKPGKRAKKFVLQQGGAAESQVAGTSIITSAINAAFAMAIMAHSDEEVLPG